MRVALSPLLSVLLVACPQSPDDLACTTEARASVQLQVSSSGGADLSGAAATYDAGDGPLPCESMGAGTFVCGWEVDGPIGITVEAPGHEAADLEVDVALTPDGCHVETVQEDVVLVALSAAD